MADRSEKGTAIALAGAVALLLVWPGGAFGQNAPPAAPPPVKKFDLYLSGHLFGLLPQDKDLSVGGNRVPNTDVRGTIGAGIKFEAYPWFTKKIVGGEVEVFGLGGSVRAPRITSGSGTTQAQGSVIAVNTMYSFILRYPGETVQPYIGVGGGTSLGVLYDTSIQSGSLSFTGSSGDVAFAYQFLGGVKTFVTKRLFLFGEYKYFGTKYSWEGEGAGDSKVKLDFQTHIVSGGLGWSF
jgi:opacity protein-like surface antigen